MKASLIPWSSVVGQSISLTDDAGANLCQLSVRYTGRVDDAESDDAFKARMISIAQAVADAINSPTSEAREADLRAEVAAKDAALREISERHISSQPMTDGGDELSWAHRQYAELRRIARAALSTPPADDGRRSDLHPDVVALIIAGREVAYEDRPEREKLRALDLALEKFAAAVPWEDDPNDEVDDTPPADSRREVEG